MAGGRPTQFKMEYCDALLEHMRSGLSYETFSATIGICRASLYVWEKAHPEFLDAKKRGFELGQLFWEKLGMQGMWNEKSGVTLNTGLWVFNMKNRFKWTDRVETVAKIPEANPFDESSDEDLDDIIGD